MQEDRSQERKAKNWGLGKLAWRKTDKEHFFSAKNGLDAAFNSRIAPRESLLEAWCVDTHNALFVKSDTSQMKGRRVRISRSKELMTLGVVCLVSASAFF